MEASGCPLDEAFGEIENIKLKKKSKKEKKKTDLIYPNEIKPIDSHFQQEMKSVQGYDNNNQFFNINGPTNTYGSLHPLQHHEHVNDNVVPIVSQISRELNKPIVSDNIVNVESEKQIEKQRNIISDKEYQEFKDYQRKRFFENHQRKLSQLEGFSNVNDDFNDVLLFGLMGFFFLMFTDYIYKLGKKSY